MSSCSTPSAVRRGSARAALIGLALLASTLAGPPAQGRAGHVERVSVSSSERQAQGASAEPVISANGRFVAFTSTAQNLVRGTVEGTDVFVRDRWEGTTRLVSRSSGWAGVPGNGASGSPSISVDGRYVGFVSAADNLVRGDTNAAGDGFVRDLSTGVVRRVTLTPRGGQLADGVSEMVLSGDARSVVFRTAAGDLLQRRLGSGRVELVSVPLRDLGDGTGDGSRGMNASVSHDGRYVVYESYTLQESTPGVFLRDVVADTTVDIVHRRAENADDGSASPLISPDGRIVVFVSDAWGITPGTPLEAERLWAWDRERDRYSVVDSSIDVWVQVANAPTTLSLSRDGRFVAYQEVVDGRMLTVVRDRVTRATTRLADQVVEDTAAHPQSWAALNARGRRVAFTSPSPRLVGGDTNDATDVFLGRLAW